MDRDLFMFYKVALEGKLTTPLCSEYKSAWRKCGDDKEMLVKLALKQQSIPYLSHACYERMGLTKEYILNNFGELINGKRTFEDVEGASGYTYQLYVGHNDGFAVEADVTSLMWCNSTLIIDTGKCPVIYASNRSDIHLVCEGYNTPRVYLFDESKLTVDDCDETCSVIVYKYSEGAGVAAGKYCLGNIKEFQKQLKL